MGLVFADIQTTWSVARSMVRPYLSIQDLSLHPLWETACNVANQNLLDLRSGLTAGQVPKIERALAVERYGKLCIGNTVGLDMPLGWVTCPL